MNIKSFSTLMVFLSLFCFGYSKVNAQSSNTLNISGVNPDAPTFSSWKTFTSKEGNFNVSLPNEPFLVSETTSKEISVASYQSKTALATFKITYMKPEKGGRAYNELQKNPKKVEGIVKEIWGNITNISKETEALLAEKTGRLMILNEKVMFKGAFGLRFRQEDSLSSYESMVLYQNGIIYILEAQTPLISNAPKELATLYSSDMKRFFNSFEFSATVKQVAKQTSSKGKK